MYELPDEWGTGYGYPSHRAALELRDAAFYFHFTVVMSYS
jgi:hypothetical protein